MSDIDKLRGTPQGHTKNLGSSALKKAAITVAVAASTLSAAPRANASTVKENDRQQDKVENIADNPTVSQSAKEKTISMEEAIEFTKEEALGLPELQELQEKFVKEQQALAKAQKSASVENKESNVHDFAEQVMVLGQDVTLQKLGVDITYQPGNDNYLLQSEANEIVVPQRELNYGQMKAQYDLKQFSKFSRPTTEIHITLNLDSRRIQFDKKNHERKYAALKVPAGLVAAYIPSVNGLINVEYAGAVSEKEKESQLNQIIQEGYSTEHEMSHRADDKSGAFGRINKTPEQRAKLDMLSEIKANMVEAGKAYEHYKKTGSLDKFDMITNSDLTEVKQYLAQNPKTENCEALIAATVYKTWLEKNNKENSYYSNQAFQMAQEVSDAAKYGLEYSAASKLTDSPAFDKEYHKVVDKMFDNVPGLGDVRAQVNPDFALNDGLVRQINERFKKDAKVTALMDLVTADAENARQANRAIKEFLQPIRQADKDGVRTPEEQAKIDAYVAQTLLEKSGRLVQKSKTPVKQTTVDVRLMAQNTNNL